MSAIGTNLVQSGFRIIKTKEGKRYVRVFEGTADAVNGLISSLGADQEYEIDDDRAPLYAVTITTPDIDDTTSNEEEAFLWELAGNDAQKSIFEHTKSLALTSKVLGVIRSSVAAVEAAEPADAAGVYSTATGDITTAAGVLQADALSLFDFLLNNQDSYLDPQYVLKLTRTVGSRFSPTAADNKVFRLYTTGEVLSEANTQATPVPSRLQAKVNAIPARTSTGYLWSWLKKPSTETQIAGGRIQITTEYVLELWATYFYLKYSDP